ncbi:similar to Saccharomyces cerevisiae YLR440C SEC39 Component of the Dsl1p tethering complex that interacts with ER SNAREs Sec20p and Use1p [Maudiozyma barnettii]|uniref:Similar to Saccharomyces cerevisiae YLR440C SEC39 Component of the Dsl1p tethering complex that interacts with ER SNAREs Sec20p and Use1p n=1 Tax=Maudiozyma barnettii TaxID=61262 RepID=A0A8H2VIZ8_9SACH|nr:Sec39p [Kazachstania barnettii]CAB4256519.1 similar to Saccharomyces cerevisiae YLR440C SEC39 Component of the Dsl1p tethering complex that interacts with ER SNAREs Sec20p and Use1p [Kazachstania barnettii]CAD1785122.1 similar to Saccharomyces cerevisiae YLR440C SEC39 Component of the Dsl1p tethering complex that interacts with ER SNAREs Sec20p and Use1p [Kazachstania barnettii]
MLVEDQLYLLSCIFATRADAKNMTRLTCKFKDSQDFINAIIILWPEYGEPKDLGFLFANTVREEEEEDVNSDDDLMISLINGDSDLISMVELDPEEVTNRVKSIKQYIESELETIEVIDNEKGLNWLAKRIIYCNDKRPEDALLYSSLWECITTKDPGFQDWIDNIVLPLNLINKRLGKLIKIKEFMEMNVKDVFQLVLTINYNENNNNSSNHILDELLPYLRYKNSDDAYSKFLKDCYTPDRFDFQYPLQTQLFTKTFNDIKNDLKDLEMDNFYNKTLEIIFTKAGQSLKNSDIINLQDVLKSIPTEITLSNYPSVTSKSLISYLDTIHLFLPQMDLMTLYTIGSEKEIGQKTHFTSICNETLLTNDTKIVTLREFINQEHKENDGNYVKIFNKLSREEDLSILYETCLSLGKFDLLQSFGQEESTTDTQLESILLEKYFWQFFKNETNGSSKRPGMIKCRKILTLLQNGSKAKSYTNLEILLEVSDTLTKYSMNLGKNIIFKPSNILDFKDDPFKIMEILLENNPQMYKSLDTNLNILESLYIALNNDVSTVIGEDSYGYNKLLSMIIDHSLVNLDFQFAMKQCTLLIHRSKFACEFWYSILQVGKFKDPNWVDNETPTEILFMQMRLLSQLLQVCPVDETEVVTQQWSEIEIEIASRDLIHDKYSFDHLNSKSSTVFKTIFT